MGNRFLRSAIALFAFWAICFLSPEGLASAESAGDGALRVGGYALAYGNYIGYETDYDHDAQKTVQKEIRAILGRDEIVVNGIATKFTVRGNHLYVGEQAMYEAVGDNKLLLLAGGGVLFEHEQ